MLRRNGKLRLGNTSNHADVAFRYDSLKGAIRATEVVTSKYRLPNRQVGHVLNVSSWIAVEHESRTE